MLERRIFVLKSICIKTNNSQTINYLLKKLENSDLKNIYVSVLKFKFYKNFIIHYKGKNLDYFYKVFSDIFSSAIIEIYEKNIIKHIISTNYFYFTNPEQDKILDIANEYIYSNTLTESSLRKDSIKISCIEYFSNNKSVILDGFINFRIENYIKMVDYIVDMAVNKFVIDREYAEFIELLKCYINSKSSNSNTVHLIYQNEESILLDEFKKNINLNSNCFDSKFLSDITFSSNDYTLNMLLTLLPKKIFIHLIDGIEDEFINTLKLVFDDRVYLCNDCNICKVYKLEKIHK